MSRYIARLSLGAAIAALAGLRPLDAPRRHFPEPAPPTIIVKAPRATKRRAQKLARRATRKAVK